MDYKFELTQIDPHSCSIEQLKEEISRLEEIRDTYANIEQSIKIYINSVYGALGSRFFPYYNVACAEAITLQGQSIAKYTNKITTDYFHNIWHTDTELHQKLGLTYVNKINPNTEIVIYGDTDSQFSCLKPVLDSCDWKSGGAEFILALHKHRIKEYIDQKFDEYGKTFNTENIQVLELEKISRTVMMVAKKKYILDLGWKEPNIFYAPQEKLKFVGIEIAQGSTPKFARKVLKEMLLLILQKKKDLAYADVIKKLKQYKAEFILQNPEDIAKTVSIGDYEKYVLEDRKNLTLAPKCPIGVRAAGIYNNIIFNSKWKSKYNTIKTGDKIKHYYCIGDTEVFGFLPHLYPYEFAARVDYDRQFGTVIIDPLNRFLNVAGLPDIPENLIYATALF